jgi:transcriptional regulator with XRE-family HTH domain
MSEDEGTMPTLTLDEAKAAVKTSKMPKYLPTHPIATFIDAYGEERIIHKPNAGSLRVFTGLNTVPQKLNPAVAVLLGQNIKKRRLELGLTLVQVAARAGMAAAGHPKNVMHSIETAGPGCKRTHSIRMGTLYAIAFALECKPWDLMPSPKEVMDFAGVTTADLRTLAP